MPDITIPDVTPETRQFAADMAALKRLEPDDLAERYLRAALGAFQAPPVPARNRRKRGMSENDIEPVFVIQLVEQYIGGELREVEQFSNRALLDTSGVWLLHELARDVYAAGVTDGAIQERERTLRQRNRDREGKPADTQEANDA